MSTLHARVDVRYERWFVLTGAPTLVAARERLLEMLEKTQVQCRSQRAYAHWIAPETMDAMIAALALCARWNRDFPLYAIPTQEPLW